MSRDKRYNREIQSQRWATLSKIMKTEAHWECSVCHCVTHRMAVHHRRPVEGIKDEDEFMRKFYDRDNLQVLCFKCHSEIHQAMGSYTPAYHQQYEASKKERNKEHIDNITMDGLL